MAARGKGTRSTGTSKAKNSARKIASLKKSVTKARAKSKPTTTIEHIPITKTRAKVEGFARLAESDPTAFNAMKEPKEYFGFKIEGNQSRTIFRDIRSLTKMLRAYLQTGSAKGAKFELVRIHGKPQGWFKARRANDSDDTKAAIKRFRDRQRKRLQKPSYKGRPYDR